MYELTTAGTIASQVDLTTQDINDNEVSGLAFDATGKLLVASRWGVVYRVTV